METCCQECLSCSWLLVNEEKAFISCSTIRERGNQQTCRHHFSWCNRQLKFSRNAVLSKRFQGFQQDTFQRERCATPLHSHHQEEEAMPFECRNRGNQEKVDEHL